LVSALIEETTWIGFHNATLCSKFFKTSRSNVVASGKRSRPPTPKCIGEYETSTDDKMRYISLPKTTIFLVVVDTIVYHFHTKSIIRLKLILFIYDDAIGKSML
jgi:hypothetical protein